MRQLSAEKDDPDAQYCMSLPLTGHLKSYFIFFPKSGGFARFGVLFARGSQKCRTQPLGILVRQVDFVVASVHPERDGLIGLTAIRVVEEFDFLAEEVAIRINAIECSLV